MGKERQINYSKIVRMLFGDLNDIFPSIVSNKYVISFILIRRFHASCYWITK